MSAVAQEIFKPSVHRAQLLTDDKGLYGLHVETDLDNGRILPERVVIRPDYVDESSPLPTLFQMVPRGSCRWADGSEKDLVYRLHNQMLAEIGIKLPKPGTIIDEPDAKYWRQWHGLYRIARRVINSLLAELYASIPTEKLRIVRRYPINYRKSIYAGLCGASIYAWQLADTFPFLARAIYAERDNDKAAEARNLVERGARLRDIAEAAHVPMEFRCFKPMVLRWVSDVEPFLRKYPYLVAHHCPDTVPRQRAWLQAISHARLDHDDDFAVWVASHYEQIGKWREVPAIVGDVNDWVRATYQSKAVANIKQEEVERIRAAMVATGNPGGAKFLRDWWNETDKSGEGRAFDRNMAARTVLRLSHEWHERAAQAEAANYPFPDPWYDGDTINGYCIVPIKAADELSRYGYQLHNCASRYSRDIASGDCFLYVVTKSDGKPLAMAEIARGDKPKLVQLKGPCNQPVTKPIQSAVRTWLTRQKRKNGVGRMPECITPAPMPLADDDFDDIIPF